MSLYGDITSLEERLQEILKELQALRFQVHTLEEQNTQLRERVALENLTSQSQETLRSLYQEGFHVCPTHFAQQRQGDCMFCLSFMEQQGIKGD